MADKASAGDIVLYLIVALASIFGAVMFFRLILHCYKKSGRKWHRVVNPLHVISFSAALVFCLTGSLLTKYIPQLVDILPVLQIISVIAAVISVADRIARGGRQTGLGTAIGCLFIELAVSLLITVIVYAVYMIIILIFGIIIASVCGSGSSGSESSEGYQYYLLACVKNGETDNVYGVNGNKDYLFSVNGNTEYFKNGDFYLSRDDDDENAYVILRRLN